MLRRLWSSPAARFVLGVILVVALSLWIFTLLMQPSVSEIGLMAVFLSITAVLSILAGYAVYRLGWLEHSPALRWTFLGVYALSGALTFVNVWFSARLMFASSHDLLLATVLLLFAGGIAMALGYFLFNALTQRITNLEQAAQAVAQGRLDARVEAGGRDELSSLARTFNQMAAQLEIAAQKQKEAEILRRDLIAWVGHDLQTPLASIRAILEALADGVVEEPHTVRRYLDMAQRDVRSLSALIDDLFQLAQLDAGGLPLDKTDNSLSDLISDTLESFSELAQRKGVSLSGEVQPGADLICMDARRIGRVLANLIGNALRHTPAGGQVSVRATQATQDDQQGVRVVVQDSGEGIPAQDLALVFERFYRGEKSRSRSTGGSGLGLAIARGLVEAHGGKIWVDSQPGDTRFTFFLPQR